MAGFGDFFGGMGRMPMYGNQADPMAGLSAIDKLRYVYQNNPEALVALGAGIMEGDVAGGFSGAAGQMSLHKKAFAEREETLKKENATRRALLGMGFTPEQAEAGMQNPTLLSHMLAKSGGGDEETFYGTPHPFRRPDGTTGLAITGSKGSVKEISAGEGFEFLPKTRTFNAGTDQVTIDIITGQEVSRVPIDLAGAEKAKVEGEFEGKMVVSAPEGVRSGEDALTLINSIKNDPYKWWGTGLTSAANTTRGSPTYAFQKKVDQARSGAFLTAIEKLRGMGALSNAEGQTATDAVTRIDTGMRPEQFDQALKDYEDIVRRGYERAKQIMATGTTKGTVTPNEPSLNDIGGSLYEKYGLER
jgi:hypothetical protein